MKSTCPSLRHAIAATLLVSSISLPGLQGAEKDLQFTNVTQAPPEPLSLWYLRPAGGWLDALDLVSGRSLPIVNGKVALAPKSAFVLRLDSALAPAAKPDAVAFVAALPGNGQTTLTWKTAAGATSYTISRADTEAGPYTPIASGVPGNTFADKTLAPDTWFYQITAVNAAGSSWPSYRARLDLSATSVAAPWRDDRIGSATTGSASVEGASITIRDANGTGHGEGNDYKIDTRDSLHFVNQPADGSFTLSARLDHATGQLAGLMLRDQLQPHTRYIYFGADATGQLVLQNRTRDTRHEVSMKVISPQRVELPGYTAASHPFLKLSRDAGTPLVTAFASQDGLKWVEVGSLFTPFPRAVHADLTATGEARFDSVTITH